MSLPVVGKSGTAQQGPELGLTRACVCMDPSVPLFASAAAVVLGNTKKKKKKKDTKKRSGSRSDCEEDIISSDKYISLRSGEGNASTKRTAAQGADKVKKHSNALRLIEQGGVCDECVSEQEKTSEGATSESSETSSLSRENSEYRIEAASDTEAEDERSEVECVDATERKTKKKAKNKSKRASLKENLHEAECNDSLKPLGQRERSKSTIVRTELLAPKRKTIKSSKTEPDLTHILEVGNVNMLISDGGKKSNKKDKTKKSKTKSNGENSEGIVRKRTKSEVNLERTVKSDLQGKKKKNAEGKIKKHVKGKIGEKSSNDEEKQDRTQTKNRSASKAAQENGKGNSLSVEAHDVLSNQIVKTEDSREDEVNEHKETDKDLAREEPSDKEKSKGVEEKNEDTEREPGRLKRKPRSISRMGSHRGGLDEASFFAVESTEDTLALQSTPLPRIVLFTATL